MVPGIRLDPYPAYNFWVEIDGLWVGSFAEVTGLQSEVEVKEYREGGLNDYVHTFRGPTKYTSRLVLKRGMTIFSELLWGWYQDVTEGKLERRNGSIVLLSAGGIPVRMWNFMGAYPMRWIGPSLRANSNELAIETLELAHQGIKPWLEGRL